MNDKFPVIPTDPDTDVEWFDTKEQAELYAAATGGKVTDDPYTVNDHMWITRARRQIRDAAEPATAKYIQILLDTKPET